MQWCRLQSHYIFSLLAKNGYATGSPKPKFSYPSLKVVVKKRFVIMSSNLGEVNTLLYDNKYGFNNNKYDFNKYWTWLCGNWKRFLAFKSQDFYRHSWSFRWIWVGVGHREIIMCSSEKGHSLVCTSMSNKAATPWAPHPGVYGTTRKWPFSPPKPPSPFVTTWHLIWLVLTATPLAFLVCLSSANKHQSYCTLDCH